MRKLFYFVAIIATIAMTSCKSLAPSYEELKENNAFKYELIQHQDSLIKLQAQLIDDLANHLQQEHDCDVPMFDSSELDNIHEQEAIIDSLYNSQL